MWVNELVINSRIIETGDIGWLNDYAGFQKLTIGNNIKNIGERAFKNCTSLTSVTIPNSIASIGNEAFAGCTSLTTVFYTGTEEQWNNITIASTGNENLRNATIIYNYVEE